MADMYDPWGVGEALQMSMRMYTHSKKGTGRSTLNLRSLAPATHPLCLM